MKLSTVLLAATFAALSLTFGAALLTLMWAHMPLIPVLHYARMTGIGLPFRLVLGALLVAAVVLGVRRGALERKLLAGVAGAAIALAAFGVFGTVDFFRDVGRHIAHPMLGAPIYAGALLHLAACLGVSLVIQLVLWRRADASTTPAQAEG